MEKFKILNERRSFYQWDYDQKLAVLDDAVTQVHFAAGAGKALVCPVYEKDGRRLADVPNILLQTQGNLRLFAVAGNRTLYSCIIPIHPREKPDDYIYTETEVWTVEQAVEEALQKAKESGAFTGPQGATGDQNVCICRFGETTWEEMKEAWDAGKVLVLQYNNYMLLLFSFDGNLFEFKSNNASMLVNCWRSKTGDWGTNRSYLPTKAEMDALISRVAALESIS